MGDNILEIKNLSKNFKDFSLNNLNLIIPRGVIMGLIGENGAGKSTTINCILNEIGKSTGEIYIFGKDHIVAETKIPVPSKLKFAYSRPPAAMPINSLQDCRFFGHFLVHGKAQTRHFFKSSLKRCVVLRQIVNQIFHGFYIFRHFNRIFAFQQTFFQRSKIKNFNFHCLSSLLSAAGRTNDRHKMTARDIKTDIVQ